MFNIEIFYRTIKDLKINQIFYYVYYKFFGSLPKTKKKYIFNKPNGFVFLNEKKCYENNEFKFLNKSKKIHNTNWLFLDFGKLWCYNLNYFNYFSQQEKIPEKKIKYLCESFYKFNNKGEIPFDPYPTSLRIINFIKYYSNNSVNNLTLEKIVNRDLNNLFSKIEYHIQGNHLLENAFALWYAAHCFDNNYIKHKACSLINKELEKQILIDGAHIELSTMYHVIILGRLLDCISIAKSNLSDWNYKTLALMINKAEKMKSWIDNIFICKNDFPMINDSAYGISPSYQKINTFYNELKLQKSHVKLTESGFRVFNNLNFQLLCDVSNIKSNFQPGHSHSDSLNFVLYLKKKPLVVDPGVTTYDDSKIRNLEKSNLYHNTVSVNYENSSEVWSSFRVGFKAKTTIIKDFKNNLQARHNGFFRKFKITHFREWQAFDKKILINDYVKNQKENIAVYFLHFHPSVKVSKINNNNFFINDVKLSFSEGILTSKIIDYNYSNGFNSFSISKKIELKFKNKLQTCFSIN